MTSFDAHWLKLREAVDHRSRNKRVHTELTHKLSDLGEIRAVDLGSGTGSNIRYLHALLPECQHWRLLDHDPGLLAIASRELSPLMRDNSLEKQSSYETIATDLSTLDPALLAHAQFITGSALLDLVSRVWLSTLVSLCVRSNSVALFALSYDGQFALHPHHPDDRLVRAALNEHQLRDKGFGPALGPDAIRAAVSLFEEAGYEVHLGASPWRLTTAEIDLQRELLAGWVSAAIEQSPGDATRFAAWHRHRDKLASRRQLVITVGHQDLAAYPFGGCAD